MEEYTIYLRKSRADLDAEAHGEGDTLLRHEKMLVELAHKKNLNVTGIYREIVSGETIAARPQMQQLLQEVEQGKWAGVLVMEIERLARGDTIDQGIVSQAFKYSNTKIITPIKTYDPTNEFDEEYFEFGLFMSRREFKTINRRVQRGRIASAKEGRFIGSTAPYGYTKVKLYHDKGYSLQINEDQARIVRMIYNWYVFGEMEQNGSKEKLGCSRIAHKLDSMGIKPTSEKSWSRSSIKDILRNPTYTGKIRWQYRKEVKQVINNVVKITTHTPEEYILVDGLHEAIIDEDIWQKAQNIMTGRVNPPVPGSAILKNPLAGLVYCGKCGSLLTRLAPSKKTAYPALKCPNIYCDNISSPLNLVEDVIIESIEDWLENYKVNLENHKEDTPYEQTISDKEAILKDLSGQVTKLKGQLDKTFEFLEQGVYTVEVFQDRRQKLTEQINNLEESKSTLLNELNSLNEKQRKNTNLVPMMEQVLDVYYDVDVATERNAMLKEVLEKVIYLKNEPNKKGQKDNANFTIELFPKNYI